MHKLVLAMMQNRSHMKTFTRIDHLLRSLSNLSCKPTASLLEVLLAKDAEPLIDS